MKYLIVTADDFGLTKGINEGILKAYREGIVTSLALMPTGEAFEDAVRIIRDIKLEEIGAHLSLTQTRPLTDPAKIPTLIAEDNKFYDNHVKFLLNFFLKKIDRNHIYIELKNQLENLKSIGIALNNISSHEHIHMVPEILNIFIALAKEYQIPFIRYPHNERLIWPFGIKKIYKKAVLSHFERPMAAILKDAGLSYTDNFRGILDSGGLGEDALLGILRSLEGGVTELVCHPGFMSPEILERYAFHVNCEAELHGLTSRRVKDMIKQEGIKLVTYGTLGAG